MEFFHLFNDVFVLLVNEIDISFNDIFLYFVFLIWVCMWLELEFLHGPLFVLFLLPFVYIFRMIQLVEMVAFHHRISLLTTLYLRTSIGNRTICCVLLILVFSNPLWMEWTSLHFLSHLFFLLLSLPSFNLFVLVVQPIVMSNLRRICAVAPPCWKLCHVYVFVSVSWWFRSFVYNRCETTTFKFLFLFLKFESCFSVSKFFAMESCENIVFGLIILDQLSLRANIIIECLDDYYIFTDLRRHDSVFTSCWATIYYLFFLCLGSCWWENCLSTVWNYFLSLIECWLNWSCSIYSFAIWPCTESASLCEFS